MRSRIVVYLILIAILGSLGYLGVRADYKTFIGSLFAAFISVYVVIFVEMELRGHIRIVEEPTAPVLPDKRKFLRVIVENCALGWPLKLFMDRRPIYQARARITFLTETNDPVFSKGRNMIGRWSNTPEPIRPISITPSASGTPQITVLRDLSVTRDAIDIGSGASELLDIVMRFPSEDGCHGWHNRMIQNPDTPLEDRFDLLKGRYHILVRVDASGRSFKALFRIVCDVGIKDFRLERLGRVPRGL